MPDYKQRFFETDAIAAQLRESCIQMSTEILEVLYPKISSLEKEAAGAYLRGFNTAKKRAVGKAYAFALYSELYNKLFGCCIWEHEKARWVNTVAEAENKPTRRAAVVTAVLDLIERETLSGKEDV